MTERVITTDLQYFSRVDHVQSKDARVHEGLTALLENNFPKLLRELFSSWIERRNSHLSIFTAVTVRGNRELT